MLSIVNRLAQQSPLLLQHRRVWLKEPECPREHSVAWQTWMSPWMVMVSPALIQRRERHQTH